MRMVTVQSVEKNKMKICKKCNGMTYSDDADKCPECKAKLEVVDSKELFDSENKESKWDKEKGRFVRVKNGQK